ncbi:YcxB family protein [Dongia deserti]|uniref:YcxB family protein n=1 Tax=Dongia deserti TaxID=2268030 RepID=UPI000E65A651|nr:YcxB family protein [Dongia deserti]
MTVAAAESMPLSIVQARDTTLAEGKQMSTVAWRHIAATCRRDPLFWAFQLLVSGALLFAMVSLIEFANQSADASSFYTWSPATIPLAFVAFSAMQSRVRIVAGRGNAEMSKAGSRYAIDGRGLTIEGKECLTHLSWQCILQVTVSDPFFAVRVSSIHTYAFPKAAFDAQQVEHFCAELERRWSAHHGSQVATERATSPRS